MIRPSPELLAMISESLTTSSGLSESENASISVPSVCRQLLQRWPKPLSQSEAESLHALCRKVHTAKNLVTTYQPDWKKRPDAVGFYNRDWKLLATVLATWSTPQGARDFEDFSIGVKCLNALLYLVERWQAAEGGCETGRWTRCAENNLRAWFPTDITKDKAA
jgi:hypothetical protein